LQSNALAEALSGQRNRLDVPLVTNLPSIANVNGCNSGLFMRFQRNALTPAEFSIALAIRLGGLPQHLSITPCSCVCGKSISTNLDLVNHALSCERTPVSHTARHNILRDAIARTARLYSIPTSTEPTCYSAFYASGRKERPDVTFHTFLPIATDVTIVSSIGAAGEAAKIANQVKLKVHTDAVAKLGHRFIPGACESNGYMGEGVFTLANELAKHLPLVVQRSFTSEFLYSASCALAKGRAAAIIAFTHLVTQTFAGMTMTTRP